MRVIFKDEDEIRLVEVRDVTVRVKELVEVILYLDSNPCTVRFDAVDRVGTRDAIADMFFQFERVNLLPFQTMPADKRSVSGARLDRGRL